MIEDQATEYQRVLGDELRTLRRGRGWTRKQLAAALQSDLSLQTLATYELGTRHCSVVRLAELCLAMEEQPQDLLARVHRRVFAEPPAGVLRLNLAAMLVDDQAHLGPLGPLYRWARERFDRGPAEVELELAVVEFLAKLCETSVEQLLHLLRPYLPAAVALA
ncbi:helix-turn-helix domain-containing protein [Amycolatopsis keratiniphila]|uniref:HTH cro/C1-type domain-containing protein n=1 Tax=Amycolatopsis keratiniphila subsp. keratiniphila TaxID=227715 RepID=A0A1W2M227_9PSEU|nr:helix-turn-helix domain-containing protein [Amycolatopsis keratiniphila]ONF73957.1 hypothetical protein AVR91_0204300 [Amycolatopsis keratiniphila subsp. keratiniphila]